MKGLWNKISPYEEGVWRRIAGAESDVSLEAFLLLTRVNVEVLVERVPGHFSQSIFFISS